MDRRNFFKLVGTASGGAMTGACGKQANEIIPLLVSEEEIEPGVEEWHAAVCGECGAACGTVARLMASEREIEVDGERVRQKIAAVKKLEGNPLDPVSGGHLCARGHAALQSLYNPDRLHGPLKRVGERGAGQFEPVAWDTAIATAGTALSEALASDPDSVLFLTQPRAGIRTANIGRFLNSLGTAPASGIGVGDFGPEIEGARRAFGWEGIPVYEIQDSTFVFSIGADFLGGWVSPVLYSRRYGHMRQGRRELRGRLVHAESRFSLTAWNADRWLPVWPGGELSLALGIGKILVSEGFASSEAPATVVSAFANTDLDRAASVSGIGIDAMREIAADLAAASAPVVLAGASIVRSDSADAVTAANALNTLLGAVGKRGGVMPPAATGTGLDDTRPASRGWVERLARAQVVIVDGVNPVYNTPFVGSVLAEAEAVISFSPFVDDTAAFADLILPDHGPLERATLTVPDASPVPSLAAMDALVAPLYDTRPVEEVLSNLAEAVGKPYESLSVEEGLAQLHAGLGLTPDDGGTSGFLSDTIRQGGWQGKRSSAAPVRVDWLGALRPLPRTESVVFQTYPSLQFGEGSGANRPWLQELPDPTSSAMWGIPVELDPSTAASVGVANGDAVRVESSHGALEAPVYVNPAAIPGVVSMALGQGHEHFGRYATGRGANPMVLMGDMRDQTTDAAAMGPVQVTIKKIPAGSALIQFSRQDRDPLPDRV